MDSQKCFVVEAELGEKVGAEEFQDESEEDGRDEESHSDDEDVINSILVQGLKIIY
jgi:hypothetical protein